MAKQFGVSANRSFCIGRVIADPEIGGGWAKFFLKTVVPEQQNGQWVETECLIQVMTNVERHIDTIQKFVKTERQLYLEGYIKGWANGQGGFESAFMITNIKLMSAKMFDPEAGPQGSNGAGPQNAAPGGMPGFPPA